MGSVKILGVAFVLFVLVGCQSNHEFAGTELSAPQPVPDIALDSVDGPVSLRDFKGNYTLVYFGYTFCPDVCPTTLAVFKQAMEKMGDEAEEFSVVMITVDPERDTPEKLAEYMNYFDSSFVGLSGAKEDIDRVGEPFGLYYEKHEGSEASGYLVDHTARFYLLDRDSNALVAYAHGTLTDDLVNDLKYVLKSNS